MSIECGECERDLRGGHDPSCSRIIWPIQCCWWDTEDKGECGQPDASNACVACPRHHLAPVEVLSPEEVLVAYFETQPDLEGIQILARECLQALKEAGFVTIKVDQCRSENEPVE